MMYRLGAKPVNTFVAFVIIITMLFVNVGPVLAYTIRSITFEWHTIYDGSIGMRFDVTANYHWVTSGRLFPLPEENYGVWKFGSINGVNLRYMVVGAVIGEDYRICLGASDSDPGNEAGLYHHPNNRCFKVWRTGGSSLSWVELFNVYGRVTNSNGDPISGVTISNGAGRSALTNSNGEYSFLNLTSDSSYILTASKSGYTFTPNSRTVSGGPPFHVTGQNFTGTNLYSISGRVTDGDGNPISSVTLATNTGHTSSTDSNGNYTLTGLTVGTYTVTPTRSGYIFVPVSRSVTLPPNATGQNFNVTNRYAISGQITDGQGNALANVPVECVSWPTQLVVKTALTNANGNYTLSDLPGGSYMVRGTGGAPYTLSPLVRLMVLPPNQGAQDFTTTPIYGTLSGRVTQQGTGQALAGARVSVGGQVGTTNGNGNYLLSSLLPGTHNIYITASGHQDHRSNVHIQANQNTVHDASLVQIRAEGYRLPYPGGANYMCTQGNNSGFSHTGSQRYAFDFGTAYNPVVAARAGRVVAVKTNGSSCGYWSGGRFYCTEACLYSANYVRIRHPDNTDSSYVHLSRVDVRVGDQVASGQQIGLSGNTGCSTGAHLHFARYHAGGAWTIPISFLDVTSNNGVPVTGGWYRSDNYRTAMLSSMIARVDEGADFPVGQLQLYATGQFTYAVRISASDYVSDNLQMRLSPTEADLNAAVWQPVTDIVAWNYPQIWGQFQNTLGAVSQIYSDTFDATIYIPVEAAFDIPPTVCVGKIPPIINQTSLMCEQCGWLWDLGDGHYSHEIEPSLPYPYTGYLDQGLYTVTLTVANADSISSVSRQIQAVLGPATAFTVTQSGTSITVTAWETNADNWEWSFGDGVTATGRIATHTYLAEGVYPVQLTIQDNNQCWGEGIKYIQVKQIYLPLVLRQ